MPSFGVIAAKLKEKYDSAIEVRLRRANFKHSLVPKSRAFKRLAKTDLVYFSKSPTFCKANPSLASYGTSGRVCNKASRGIDGCHQLCCGRPFVTKLEVVTFKCNCTFVWCCSVKCQECSKLQQITKCTWKRATVFNLYLNKKQISFQFRKKIKNQKLDSHLYFIRK